MSYVVSQLRRDISATYMNPIGSTVTLYNSPSPFDLEDPTASFTDLALQSTFQANHTYYLRFKVHKIPNYYYSGITEYAPDRYGTNANELRLKLVLTEGREKEDTETPPLQIGSCSISVDPIVEKVENNLKINASLGYSTYSFIFTPSKTFNFLVFRIDRNNYDAIEKNKNIELDRSRKWLIERTISNLPSVLDNDIDDDENKITTVKRFESANSTIIYKIYGLHIYVGNDINGNADLYELNNLVNNKNGWTKFGFQCRPGSQIVVNKEPIIVGRSGIYEINNGTIINQFMIAAPGGSDPTKIDPFLLDYAYKD